jgi:hypothetical protein
LVSCPIITADQLIGVPNATKRESSPVIKRPAHWATGARFRAEAQHQGRRKRIIDAYIAKVAILSTLVILFLARMKTVPNHHRSASSNCLTGTHRCNRYEGHLMPEVLFSIAGKT